MTQTIEIHISKEGDIRLVTHGYAGESCRDATYAMERALGMVQTDLPTPEMFVPVQEPVHQNR